MTRTNTIFTSFFFAAALSAQQAQPQQPMVVYFNGQPMMLTPVQQAPVATNQAIYQQGQGQMMMPPQGQMAIMPQQPQYPQYPQAQGNPYGTLPQYVGQGAGVTGTQARRMSLPTGAPVYIRLISALASDRVVPGAPFEASLDAPLTDVSGMVIAERGARVEGRISESDAAVGSPGTELEFAL